MNLWKDHSQEKRRPSSVGRCERCAPWRGLRRRYPQLSATDIAQAAMKGAAKHDSLEPMGPQNGYWTLGSWDLEYMFASVPNFPPCKVLHCAPLGQPNKPGSKEWT